MWLLNEVSTIVSGGPKVGEVHKDPGDDVEIHKDYGVEVADESVAGKDNPSVKKDPGSSAAAAGLVALAAHPPSRATQPSPRSHQ